MHINRLKLENVRTFATANYLEFVHADMEGVVRNNLFEPSASKIPIPRLQNVNLLLGENGSGKTTVLRAIAASAFGPAAKDILRDSSIVRFDETEGRILANFTMHEQDGPPGLGLEAEIILKRRGERLFVDEGSGFEPYWAPILESRNDAFFVVGYGATRRVERLDTYDSGARTKSRTSRDLRVQSLFEDSFSLIPLASWLPLIRKTKKKRYDSIVDILNAVLAPGRCVFTGKQNESGDYLFAIGNTPIPFQSLSDGYRAIIGWVADLLYHMNHGANPNQNIKEMRGIVLVDEIDLHLHPRWQMRIVKSIADALPHMQFIFTSHSPLVAGSLEWMNILLLKSNRKENRSTHSRLKQSIYGLDADQILISKFFGLTSSRAASMVQQLSRLKNEASLGDDEAKRRYLRALSSGLESVRYELQDEQQGDENE